MKIVSYDTLIMAFFFLILAPVISVAGEISSVIVRNEKLEIINVLSNAKTISSFESLWKKKTKVSPSAKLVFAYKIDIKSQGNSDRWLYSPEGFVQVLSKAKVTTYKIFAVHEFNELIGIQIKYGFRIVNSGKKDIKEIRVMYPEDEYKIANLSAAGGVDERPIALSGQTTIKLRIVYVDGNMIDKEIKVFLPSKSQLFQIAIEDGGEIYLR